MLQVKRIKEQVSRIKELREFTQDFSGNRKPLLLQHHHNHFQRLNVGIDAFKVVAGFDADGDRNALVLAIAAGPDANIVASADLDMLFDHSQDRLLGTVAASDHGLDRKTARKLKWCVVSVDHLRHPVLPAKQPAQPQPQSVTGSTEKAGRFNRLFHQQWTGGQILAIQFHHQLTDPLIFTKRRNQP